MKICLYFFAASIMIATTSLEANAASRWTGHSWEFSGRNAQWVCKMDPVLCDRQPMPRQFKDKKSR